MTLYKGTKLIAGHQVLYSNTGTNTDGAMTQAATTTELDNCVRKTGDESIAGVKTFTEQMRLTLATPNIKLLNSNVIKGTTPSSNQYWYLSCYDSLGIATANRIGNFEVGYNVSGEAFASMLAYRPVSGSTTSAGIYVKFLADGSGISYVNVVFRPASDNTITLGDSSHRWKQIYAITSTISTSDERMKVNIENIPDEVLEAWGEVNFYQYKFIDAVEEKGENARYHTGMIAQRIEQVFSKHNINAFEYGLLCYDEWEAKDATYEEDGSISEPAIEAGNRYSLRYEECLCMEAAYQRYRANKLEERVSKIEEYLKRVKIDEPDSID